MSTALPGRRQLFIYYRLPPAQWPALREAALGAQSELRKCHPGLCTRLFHRDEADRLTVMEVYAMAAEAAAAGVDAALAQRIEDVMTAALAPWLVGAPRHLEFFDETCAS